MNNMIESVRRGLACAGLEETSHNLKQLVNFPYKVKREQRSLYQVSSEDSLREQARGKATLKHKTIFAECVSYQIGNSFNTNTNKSAEKHSDVGRGDRKSENYKKLRNKF